MNYHHAIAGLLLAASMAASMAAAQTTPVTQAASASPSATPLARWGLDEQGGSQAVEQVSGRRDQVNYVFNRARFKPDSVPLWRPAASCIQQGCLLFDGYSTDVTAPPLTSAQLQSGFTLSAWVAPHAFEWGDGGHYSAFVSQFDAQARQGFRLASTASVLGASRSAWAKPSSMCASPIASCRAIAGRMWRRATIRPRGAWRCF